MKNKFKFFIFAIIFASVSSAKGSYLYMLGVEKAPDVMGCPMDPRTGNVSGNCFSSEESVPIKQLVAIATYPGIKYFYAAGGGELAVCTVDVSGHIVNCKLDEGAGPLYIHRMALDPIMMRLYYISDASNGQSTLNLCELDYSGMSSACYKLISGLVDATGVAVSPDGSYVYITNRGTSSIYICHIEDEGYMESCSNNVNQQIVAPTGIAIDRDYHYAYIIDGQSPDGGLKSCLLTKGGSALGACNSFTSVPGYTGATSIILSADGHYSYISYPLKHVIVKCLMTSNGEFTDCKPTDLELESPQDLAYN